jgi:hypothetical protein
MLRRCASILKRKSNDWRQKMGQIIDFKRRDSDFKAEAVEAIQKDENPLHLFVSFPKEDEGSITFISNFDPGIRELSAVETVLNFLTSQHFTVEMEK